MDGYPKVKRKKDTPSPQQHTGTGGYYAVQLTGKNKNIWVRWRSRFVARVKNKVEGFFSRKGPRGKSVKEEANEALDNAVHSLQALLTKAPLQNEKLIAEVAKLRADIEKTHAEKRYLDAQSKKLELEIEIQRIQTSIIYIEGLVAKGALHAREDAGGFYIHVRNLPKKEDLDDDS